MVMLSRALKALVVMSMLSIFGLPAFAQKGTSPCITTLLQGSCASDNNTSTADIDMVKCCNGVQDAIMNDQKCMCHAFQGNATSANTLLTVCNINFDVGNCPADSSLAPPPLMSSSTSSPPPSGSNSRSTIIAIVIAVVVIVVIIITIVIFCTWKNKTTTTNPHEQSNIPGKGYVELDIDNARDDLPLKTSQSLHYNLATIKIATNDFSDDNIIGRGGFGLVYKGILSDGQEIAVKRLSKATSSQGDQEFKAEIELLAMLRHKNIVNLLGFCMTKDETLLVYEFMSNKSLDHFLFVTLKRGELKWPMRFEIIKGIARGMLYLHEDSPQMIIHRDLKGANVLLDANMNPKIADFGTARICDLHQTHVVATQVIGTKGYMSPEYLLHKQFSAKSDVYALGVLFLEIVSGRSSMISKQQSSGALSEDLIPSAWRCWEEEKPLELTDPLLKDLISSGEVIKCVHLGLLCVQDDPNKRPSMSTIVNVLNSNYGTSDLPNPPKFLVDTTTEESVPSVITQSTGVTTGTSYSSWG